MVEFAPYEYPIIIRYRGLFDYDGLMALLRKFFAEYRFEKVNEPKFKFKVGGTGAEAEFRIKGFRIVSEYIKITLQIDGHVWGIKRTLKEFHGEKKLVTSGKIQLQLSAKIGLDYNKLFDSSKKKGAEKKLIEWMHQRLDDPYMGMQFGENYVNGLAFTRGILNDLSTRIKKHLRMECV